MPSSVAQQVVGLADQLHVAVFDAVVDHLDVMAGPLGRRPSRSTGVPSATLAAMAWKIGLTCGQAAGSPPGMIDGPLQRPFLAAGNARADEEQPLGLEVPGAPGRVGIMRVAAVDEDVARLEQRDQLVDHVVDRRRRP